MNWIICISLMLCVFCCASAAAWENRIAVQIENYLDNSVVQPGDTIYAEVKYSIQILMENSTDLCGFNLSFRVYSDGGETWNWNSQSDGLPDTGLKAVTVVPGSRIYPDWELFEWTHGLSVTEWNVDGVLSDTIKLFAYSLDNIWIRGPSEPAIEMNLILDLPPGNETGEICIDSATIPPGGSFVYYYSTAAKDGSRHAIPAHIDGPFCWPVKRFIRGDFDMDGQITVSDPVEIIKFIFQGKPNIGPVEAGDANCDGVTLIGDAIFLINYIFKHGPAPGCP